MIIFMMTIHFPLVSVFHIAVSVGHVVIIEKIGGSHRNAPGSIECTLRCETTYKRTIGVENIHETQSASRIFISIGSYFRVGHKKPGTDGLNIKWCIAWGKERIVKRKRYRSKSCVPDINSCSFKICCIKQ